MAWKSKSRVVNALKSAEPLVASWLCVSLLLSSSPVVFAGDILRGGAAMGQSGSGASRGAANASQAALAARLRANSNDALSRTTQAVQSVKGMQAAARALAASRNNLGVNPNNPSMQLPDVPNGLVVGGLVPKSGLASEGVANPVSGWVNAETPVQRVDGKKTIVSVKQTAQQALLEWSSFNIGRDTKLKFDQSAGGANKSKWIAFNQITDPSGIPSQILGSIEAPGQVYVINQNGVIFGGASQINTHVLTVSSLPLNTNLYSQGLLNNPDAQFLFSALNLAGGADGTPAFTPAEPTTPSGKPGDIIVQAGAQLTSPLDSEGKGGRVMLVAPNITNEGTISTPSGQTILAAGMQVGVAAHPTTDPSLRGLDVWVGYVGDGQGTIKNAGDIYAPNGSITFVGKTINQLGILDSTTSVDLNGRIDLLASYGAVSNPNYDNSGALGYGGPLFLNQFTGVTTLGEGSVIRIIPSTESVTTPGTSLSQSSQVNILGLAIHPEKGSMLYAPSGNVALKAGTWPYRDSNGDGTVLRDDGSIESTLINYYSEGKQRFLFDAGQVYIESDALLSVAGLTDVFLSLDQNILNIEMRGSELADSPLQRLGSLAAVLLTIDLRKSGDYNGRYWMGTPLGDATGFAALLERTASQKSVFGGKLSINAGDSIVVRKGATLDVSGGYFRNEGGIINTTRLVQGSNIVDIANADPGQIYDGIYNPDFVVSSPRWGVADRYVTPLSVKSHYEHEYLSGAAGGALSLVAPSMAVQGDLRGSTLHGERQRTDFTDFASLNIAFRGEKIFSPGDDQIFFLTNSPKPPTVTFISGKSLAEADAFQLTDGKPNELRADLIANAIFSPELLEEDGFGRLTVDNVDGDIVVPAGVTLETVPYGSITLSGANIKIGGVLSTPGGALTFNTYNQSPTAVLEFGILNPSGGIYPAPNVGRGLFELTGKLLSAGTIVDDRTKSGLSSLVGLKGGTVSVNAYDAIIGKGSMVDVSGGITISQRGIASYGVGGSISLLGGRDPVLPSSFGSGVYRLVGGSLVLDGEVRGYSGGRGGSLAIQSSLIEVGKVATVPGALLIKPDFFQKGGFTSFTLTGIGAPSSETPVAGQPDPYLAGITIAPGTEIRPMQQSILAIPNAQGGGFSTHYHYLAEGLRNPVNVSFSATGFDNPFTEGILEIRGDLVMGTGSRLHLDTGATASFSGQTVSMLGSVIAPAGKITIAGASSFPLASAVAVGATHALSTVYIGSSALLDARGTTLFTPDAYGRQLGNVYSGGTITVSGNIVAEAGAVLDVSGASQTLDVPLWELGIDSAISARSGVTSSLGSFATQRTRVDSSGGLIDLTGSQMLFSDATLLGHAGGKNANGGWLSIFSGRFYPSNSARTSADINLVVKQSGSVIPAGNSNLGIGIAVLDESLQPVAGMGYFAADRFLDGGFNSLDLGSRFLDSATPLPYGGNLRFDGAVAIAAKGYLRLAGGGIIQADQAVSLSAAYMAVGQPFRAPENPGDIVLSFQQTLALSPEYHIAPTYGSGNLSLDARYIDVGTLVLRNIGAASLTAQNDIRGNGSLNIAGDLTLKAGQIYPTTLSNFDIFAYDYAGGKGSITVLPGRADVAAPMVAGGNLSLYASTIVQSGYLRSPLGTINLGWDGSDIDSSDVDIDGPKNRVVGSLLSAPVTESLVLGAGGITSVSAVLPNGETLVVPFGFSPDGSSWYAPDGSNVSLTGLPSKNVMVRAESVVAEAGSIIDIRGGGDLSTYRFVSGTGGSTNLLGSPSGVWSASKSYKTGDLVSYQGVTWSARADSSGVSPSVSLYWTRVAESYAILPGYNSELYPYAPFNTGVNANALQGNPGYIDSNLQWGDSIYLSGVKGLKSGNYTLLPKMYAMLPGAYLVTPDSGGGSAINYVTPEGASVVSGYRTNSFISLRRSGLESRFEVASRDVVAGRVYYETYSANTFMPKVAKDNNAASVQRLPGDAGHLVLHGNSALSLENIVLSQGGSGRGGLVDISSSSDILIGDGNATGSGIVLDAGLISSWGVESLLVGGIRNIGVAGITGEVRTSSITVDNAGTPLRGSDVILVANNSLTLSDGASIIATGAPVTTDLLEVLGDGALVRVTTDPASEMVRTGVGSSTSPLLSLGANTLLQGGSVVLDSSYGTIFDSLAVFDTQSLTLGSGQISIVLSGDDSSLPGTIVTPHLVLSGQLLEDVQKVSTLKMTSYTSIDFYGEGSFGNFDLDLDFNSSGIRGYGQNGGSVSLVAKDALFANSSSIAAQTDPALSNGSLVLDAKAVHFGENNFQIAGFNQFGVNATDAVVTRGKGSFTMLGDLTVQAPLMTGEAGSSHGLTSTGVMTLSSMAGASSVQPGLGATLSLAGSSIHVDTDIQLPSGRLNLHALSGDLVISGGLSVAGTEQHFFDLTRYTSAGQIVLQADYGNVVATADSVINVAAAANGGNAGILSVLVPEGDFTADGSLLATAGKGGESGSFILDIKELPSAADLNSTLDQGSFYASRRIRVRSGDVEIDGVTTANEVMISADQGDITVSGRIDASGKTGGSIDLSANGSLIVQSGAVLTVHAEEFSSAGKGGSITLEAGVSSVGVANPSALLDLSATGSLIDLGVDSLIEGGYSMPGTSAFNGQFAGTLHLRAPRTSGNNDLKLSEIGATISGASGILAEGYEVVDLTNSNGNITGWRSTFTTLPTAGTVQRQIYDRANTFLSLTNYNAMMLRLLGSDSQNLTNLFVLAPGVEIVNRTGDLTIGSSSATATALGSATQTSADWNLADFRFGPKKAAGILTLRAAGNLNFYNALSDGFSGTLPTGTVAGNSLWLSPLMSAVDTLPMNLQSWSYRLVAGSDLTAANFREVKTMESLAPDKGSLLLGKTYSSNLVSGANASTATALTNRYQVIRTGAGDIDIYTARDVKLRNVFSSIYTAGVALPTPTTIYSADDFVLPSVAQTSTQHPDQGSFLGAAQQIFRPQWSMAGGDLTIEAKRDIGRYTVYNGVEIFDTSRQLPANWLYRRGYVDPATGLFGVGGVDGGLGRNVTDASASTTWWIDFSNFFQGLGVLGGGDLTVIAGHDIVNVDAVVPTNARMPGRVSDGGGVTNAAPNAAKLHELGGGNLLVRAGNDISGGIYYVERGEGTLFAGGSITTNESRSPSLGILGSNMFPEDIVESSSPSIYDSLTWLPTSLFVGKSSFDVTALGSVLLGPTSNVFLTPQGLNNKFWYKTYFSTLSPEASVSVASYGGSVTHRLAVTLPGETTPRSVLEAWLLNQNLYAGSAQRASYYQPWIRLAEADIVNFQTVLEINAPSLASTAFSGEVNVVGALTLYPSAKGSLELAALGAVNGLNPTGKTTISDRATTVWSSATINLSDADPSLIPGIASPLAYQVLAGRTNITARDSRLDPFTTFNALFDETGSYSGAAGTPAFQRMLHAPGLLHLNDFDPVRIYAAGGDISGLTLFSPKETRILADEGISDIAFYLQNNRPTDISIVAAGTDLIAYNANSVLRSEAGNFALGNTIGDLDRTTATGGKTQVLAGDIQINGPGALEVFAGRNLDLGSGVNLADGTGVGITSIGNYRNPFLPFGGADLILGAGVGFTNGLAGGAMDYTAFIDQFILNPAVATTDYLAQLGVSESGFLAMNNEEQAIVALEIFYRVLRDSGRAFSTGVGTPYTTGNEAIAALFPNTFAWDGNINTRARDLRTTTGGAISIFAPGGGVSMASDIFGNPLTPPGIVTEYGGSISIFTDGDVDIGRARIFTLRGGDIVIWSSHGNIAAGTSPKTVVTAPPTRVVVDVTSADVSTDLGGLATGGGIGVLASVPGVAAGDVDLIAPSGVVDAGDAGIRSTGNLSIAATTVLNAGNIQVNGASAGVPSGVTVSTPNISGLTAATSAAGAVNSTAQTFEQQSTNTGIEKEEEEASLFSVEVIGYGG